MEHEPQTFQPIVKRDYSATKEEIALMQLHKWFLSKFNCFNLQPIKNKMSRVDAVTTSASTEHGNVMLPIEYKDRSEKVSILTAKVVC